METPQQRRRREIQAQTQQIQQVHLRDRLHLRLLAAEQRGDLRLIRQLRREWDELFPEAPDISQNC
ncbi:hypothetical protein CKA32_005928 [Geitlerinema sp. FC II]|nr:hypothetical protein CKA32_005928 [Geitlerinema sp. FC II]